MTTDDWIKWFPTLLTPIATGAAIFVAWEGLKTWRRQLHGTAGFGVARRTMLAVYRIRLSIRCLRDGTSSADSFRERKALTELFSEYSLKDDVFKHRKPGVYGGGGVTKLSG